jgi:putative peptidoglycan lipid II flippase
VGLGILFAPQLANLYAEKYAAIPGKLELTIQLTRFNMPFLLLIAIAAAFMGMLNALRRFFAPAVAPAMYNVVFITAALGLYPLFKRLGIPPIMSLTAGMLLGGVAQIVTQLPVLRREGYHHQWVLDARDPGLRDVMVLMGPGTLGGAAAQVNLFVNTMLATAENGAAAALGYSFRLMYMPIGIFAVSVATATVPELARHAAANDLVEMRRTLSWALRLMLMLSVPATLGLMVLSQPIVSLIYERGQFDATSERMVATTLFYYSIGIVGYSIVKIAMPSFYALRDARTPVFISLATIASNVGLNLWLHRTMGYQGLALGTSIAATLNAGLLLAILARRLGGLDSRRVLLSFLKISAASMLMAAVVYVLDGWIAAHMSHSGLQRLIRVGAGVGAGVATLAATAHLLRIEEFGAAMRPLLKRLGAQR